MDAEGGVRPPRGRADTHVLDQSACRRELWIDFRALAVLGNHDARSGYLMKFTFGTAFASAGASKYGYSLKLKTLAVMFAGNVRRSVS
jgi:hypothetical protein